MAHSCKDKNQCILKYTTFLFLLTSILAFWNGKLILAACLIAVFVTSMLRYWFPHKVHDILDVVVVGKTTCAMFLLNPVNFISSMTLVYNCLVFYFISRNNCTFHATLHIMTFVGCLPWIYWV